MIGGDRRRNGTSRMRPWRVWKLIDKSDDDFWLNIKAVPTCDSGSKGKPLTIALRLRVPEPTTRSQTTRERSTESNTTPRPTTQKMVTSEDDRP